jgi:phage protein D
MSFSAAVLRQPRLLVLANGVALPGVLDAEVVNTSHCGADRFHVRAALGADFVGMSMLVDDPSIRVEVQASLDGGQSFVSLIQGSADQLELDPIGGLLELSGRDDSAGLIEARTGEIFANRTSSEIAGLLAGRHGLLADVQATTMPVGRYWQLEHDSLVLDQFGRNTTEWDLLVMLARQEGFDVWVGGGTLHFRPPDAGTAPVVSLGPGDMVALRLDRTLTLAASISVTVKSWNSLKGAATTTTVQRSTGGVARSYVYVVPNLTPEAAQSFAQSRLSELIQHERVLVAEMPGELVLMPRDRIVFEGSMTGFDQNYVIDRVERQISMAQGFTQSVHAKSSNADGSD